MEPELISRHSDWLQAWRPEDRSSIPSSVKNILYKPGIHPASYPMDAGAGAWSWKLTFNMDYTSTAPNAFMAFEHRYNFTFII
jgi:hypothetical protein